MQAASQVTRNLRYPDFLGIGVQKCGTGWIETTLRDHQELWLPAIKELHYFTGLHMPASHRGAGDWRRAFARDSFQWHFENTPPDDWDYKRFGQLAHIASEPADDDWYGLIFAAAGPYQVCGEITPDYAMLSDRAIRHIVALSPQIKILIALRDPIERDWSEIRMVAEETGVSSLDDLHEIAGRNDLILRTDYAALLARWSPHVPPERTKIVFLDDIEERPDAVTSELCRFLGVGDYHYKLQHLDQPINAGPQRAMPETIYAALKERHRASYGDLQLLFPEMARRWFARHYPD